jgi:hypothetical protein
VEEGVGGKEGVNGQEGGRGMSGGVRGSSLGWGGLRFDVLFFTEINCHVMHSDVQHCCIKVHSPQFTRCAYCTVLTCLLNFRQ